MDQTSENRAVEGPKVYTSNDLQVAFQRSIGGGPDRINLYTSEAYEYWMSVLENEFTGSTDMQIDKVREWGGADLLSRINWNGSPREIARDVLQILVNGARTSILDKIGR